MVRVSASSNTSHWIVITALVPSSLVTNKTAVLLQRVLNDFLALRSIMACLRLKEFFLVYRPHFSG